MFRHAAILFFCITLVKCLPGIDRTVRTPLGLIRGIPADDGDYTMFLAIPFGVVDNPFGDAKPHPGFKTTYEANQEGIACPQNKNENIAMGIDCLNINVYVPNNLDRNKKYAVMVFVHGGAFVRNSSVKSRLGPRYLVQHDVIVVTHNYRLGIYGSLCLDIPGYNNQAMKDTVLALKWVQDNIASFGGDPNKVTTFGQSAGSMTLDILTYAGKPLYNRVILQGGLALWPWSLIPVNNSVPISVAKGLGYDAKTPLEALDFLKTKSTDDVIKTTIDLGLYVYITHPKTKPCIEPPSLKDALLTDYPVNLRPHVKGMDIMIGHSVRDAAFLYPDKDKEFYKNYQFSFELNFDFNEILDEKIVKNFYIGDKEPSFELRHEILDFATDFNLIYPNERSVQRYLEEEANSVYWYMFKYLGERNRNRIRYNITSEGAIHGDEMGYLWDLDIFHDGANDEDKRMIAIMSKLWTDFAKYGNPTPKKTELLPLIWPKVDKETRPYLIMDKNFSISDRPFKERMGFWELYYQKNHDKIRGLKLGKTRKFQKETL